jgi:hypothetical protein
MIMRYLRILSNKLTYANVVSTLCLFMLLGGASYAAATLPKNSVGAKQIKKGSVSIDKLSKATLKSLAGAPGPAGANGRDGANGAQGPKGTAGFGELFSAEGSADIASGGNARLAQTPDLPAAGTYLVNAHVKLVAGATPQNYLCGTGALSSGGGTGGITKTITVPANSTGELHFAQSLSAAASQFFYVACNSTSGAATVHGAVSAVPYADYIRVQ